VRGLAQFFKFGFALGKILVYFTLTRQIKRELNNRIQRYSRATDSVDAILQLDIFFAHRDFS
jgi:hypothetical protein